MVCERERVTKLCVKDGVWQRWCVKDGVAKDGVWQSCVWKMVCDKDGVWQSGVWQSGVWQSGVWKMVCDKVSKMVCDKVVCERWCVKDGVCERWCVTKWWVKDGVRASPVPQATPEKKPASSAWLTLPSHEPISTDMGSTGSGPSFRPSAERRGARPHWAGASSWTHPSEITITTFKYTDF